MPNFQDMPDNELAVLSKNGNESAFKEILNRHRSKMIAICMKMLGNITEAEEAAQDSFVKIYYNLSSFDISRSFMAWAASIAMNECRDRLRKRLRAGKIFKEIKEYEIDKNASFEYDPDYKLKIKNIESAIEQLSDNEKEVIVLKAYGEHSYEEIADILNIKTGTVMSRLYRAREKLTSILNRESKIE